MKCLVFYAPTINHNEFEKEARRFARCHKIPKADVIPIETECVTRLEDLYFTDRISLRLMRKKVMFELRKRRKQDYDCVAFFCHGWPKKLQLGFRMASVPALAKRIAEMSGKSITVILYACSTALDDHTTPDACGMAEDGGFAHELRDGFSKLVKRADVYAHTTSGHLSYNPHVVVHNTRFGINNAYYLITPGCYYWKEWRKRLRKNKDFRFRFPFMDASEREEEIS